MLTDLQATQTSSSIFSAPIWQFSVRPDSEQAQQPAARSDEPGTGGEGVPQHERASGEASTSQAAQAARGRDLPYHRFAGRDNVILAALDQRLKKKDSDYVRGPTCLVGFSCALGMMAIASSSRLMLTDLEFVLGCQQSIVLLLLRLCAEVQPCPVKDVKQ